MYSNRRAPCNSRGEINSRRYFQIFRERYGAGILFFIFQVSGRPQGGQMLTSLVFWIFVKGGRQISDVAKLIPEAICKYFGNGTVRGHCFSHFRVSGKLQDGQMLISGSSPFDIRLRSMDRKLRSSGIVIYDPWRSDRRIVLMKKPDWGVPKTVTFHCFWTSFISDLRFISADWGIP